VTAPGATGGDANAYDQSRRRARRRHGGRRPRGRSRGCSGVSGSQTAASYATVDCAGVTDHHHGGRHDPGGTHINGVISVEGTIRPDGPSQPPGPRSRSGLHHGRDGLALLERATAPRSLLTTAPTRAADGIVADELHVLRHEKPRTRRDLNSAPPQAVQRLTGVTAPTRTGSANASPGLPSWFAPRADLPSRPHNRRHQRGAPWAGLQPGRGVPGSHACAVRGAAVPARPRSGGEQVSAYCRDAAVYARPSSEALNPTPRPRRHRQSTAPPATASRRRPGDTGGRLRSDPPAATCSLHEWHLSRRR
jgi:hypothetical protein